jgi:calcineurin-like phosphoesterase family protein
MMDLIKGEKMSKIFYIADTHFGHENIIKLDNRPFKSVEEMNETMLNNWNSVVSKEDVVYLIGDVMWHFKDEDFEFMKKLNGRKRLVVGNHDRNTHSKNFKNLFESMDYYDKIKDGEHTVILSHYPILAYDGSYGGRNIHLHGHVHTTMEWTFVKEYIATNKSETYPMRIYNVGAMMPWMNYTPRTLEEILNRFEKKSDVLE